MTDEEFDQQFIGHRQEKKFEADALIEDPTIHTPRGPGADGPTPPG